MAAVDVKRVIRNAPYRYTFAMRNNAGQLVSGATSLISEVSLDSGTFTGVTPGVTTEISSTGIYYIDLSTAEMSASLIDLKTSSGTANTTHFRLTPEPNLHSGIGQPSGATGTTLQLPTSASNVANYYSGAVLEIVRGTGAGQFRTIVSYSTQRVAQVDRTWAITPNGTLGTDAQAVYIIHPRSGVYVGADMIPLANVKAIDDDTTAATLLQGLYTGGLVESTVSLTPTANNVIVGAVGLPIEELFDDLFVGAFLLFTSGELKGVARKIVAYEACDRKFTVTSDYPVTPVIGDSFVIIGRAE
jgi:hypothetical protein